MSTRPSLGEQLDQINNVFMDAIFNVGEGMALATDAFDAVAKQIAQHGKGIKMSFPIGQSPNGRIMQTEEKEIPPEALRDRFIGMRDRDLPLVVIYNLVTMCEAWMTHVLRAILVYYPRKIPQKRQVSVSSILNARTIEEAHIAAADSFLHELTYLSPRDFAKQATSIIGFDISELAAFDKYAEIKATRDIWIHNLGVANDIYCSKAGSHARTKTGTNLPVTPAYALISYEVCLQLIETAHQRLGETWPPPPNPPAPLFEKEGKEHVAGDNTTPG